MASLDETCLLRPGGRTAHRAAAAFSRPEESPQFAEHYPKIGERADIWKASLLVRMDTGWKPRLLYAVAARDGSVEMLLA
jgi:hypothetical protein